MRVLAIIVVGVATVTLAACSTSTPTPTSDIQWGGGQGIPSGTPAPVGGDSASQRPSPSPSPISADQDSTSDSIDVVYSTVASMIGGDPLSPLFGDWPEDRPAIDRLAVALGSAVPITPTEHLTANDRGRYLTIRYRDGAELMVRQVSWCEDWGGRRDFIGGACRGEHKPLTDTWWVEGTGMVKSAALGSWWEDMTSFMVPIGGIIAPKSLKPGDTFTVSGYGWEDQIETPTMELSLVSAYGHEVELADLPIEADMDYFEEQVVAPGETPRGRYWFRVSGGGFSELVDVVEVE